MKKISLGANGPSVEEFISPKTLNKNDTIEGTYLESFTSGEYETLTHKIELKSGKIVGLNGAGQLNRYLERVQPGTNVKIVYLGKEKIAKGPNKGKPAHAFDVYVDEAMTDEAV